MSWKHVFDSNKIRYETIEDAAKMAAKCGYKFLTWNGKVYFILSDNGEVDVTGITTDELYRFYESA